MQDRTWRVWIITWLGLAVGHLGLSWYAFVHYQTALTYFIRPKGLLFEYTLALPQCLEQHLPPDLSAFAWLLPGKSLLLAAVCTLLVSAQAKIRLRPGGNTVLFRSVVLALLVLAVSLCFSGIINVTSIFMNVERAMIDLRSEEFPTLAARTAWLHRLQPLPGQVLDTRYALQAYIYPHGVRLVHFDIAARVPPAEVDRWRKLTWDKFTPVTKDPRQEQNTYELMTWPTDAAWRHTSTPEYYQDDDAFLVIYRREGIILLHRR